MSALSWWRCSVTSLAVGCLIAVAALKYGTKRLWDLASIAALVAVAAAVIAMGEA